MQEIILFLVIVYWVYIGWFKTIKSYKDLNRRASRHALFRNRKQAIEVLKWGGLQLNLNDLEQSNIKLKIASFYYKDGNYDEACTYYEAAFNQAKKLPKLYVGENSLREAIVSFSKCNKTDKGRLLYEALLERGSIKKNRRLERLLKD